MTKKARQLTEEDIVRALGPSPDAPLDHHFAPMSIHVTPSGSYRGQALTLEEFIHRLKESVTYDPNLSVVKDTQRMLADAMKKAHRTTEPDDTLVAVDTLPQDVVSLLWELVNSRVHTRRK